MSPLVRYWRLQAFKIAVYLDDGLGVCPSFADCFSQSLAVKSDLFRAAKKNRFAGPNANFSDLHLAAICVTANSAFLRYNELASPRCCDFSFCDTFVKIYVFKRKTDVQL